MILKFDYERENGDVCVVTVDVNPDEDFAGYPTTPEIDLLEVLTPDGRDITFQITTDEALEIMDIGEEKAEEILDNLPSTTLD